MLRYLLILCFIIATSSESVQYDVAVYGSTPSGIIAAVTSARAGKSVAIISVTREIGGMVTGGLSATDKGNSSVIGGFTLEFFELIGKQYGKDAPVWVFDPSVAVQVFRDMIHGQFPTGGSITMIYDTHAYSVTMSDNSIQSLVLIPNNATAQAVDAVSFVTVNATVFIDASYEGALLPLANVSYTYGRESNETYQESFNGRLAEPSALGHHQFPFAVPYRDSTGHIVPLINTGDPGVPGQADRMVQAYNYRLCFTKDPAIRAPLPKPLYYNTTEWDLLASYTALLPAGTTASALLAFNAPSPRGQVDINNSGPISTDVIGGSWTYVEASWEQQQEIAEQHAQYTMGLLWFLSQDERCPQSIRGSLTEWGLCKNEWTDNSNWPPQLYVREARRMLGEYIFTQHDKQTDRTKSDTIGVGSYNIDTHHAQRFIQGDWVLNDGDVEQGIGGNFEIPYRSLLPLQSQVRNLIVPVCVSASHSGYGCLRLEPQYMIMGQAGM